MKYYWKFRKSTHQLPFLLLFFFIVLLNTNVSGQGAGYFISGNRKININSFNTRLIKAMQDLGIPAVSLAVIDNNKVVFSEGVGFKQKNGSRADKETIFEACSLSKSFLVFVAHKLVEQGMLDLDKPMYQYMENESLQGDPRYRLITPRMLLSHSSGIENWRDMNDPDSLEITATPGSQYVYSGEGYHYLAEVIQELMKEDYEKTIRRMVFKPLGLRRSFTTYSKDGKFPVNYAVGYDLVGKKVDKWKNSTPVPASGVHTTAHDYATLITAFFRPGNFSAQTLENLLHPAVRIIEKDDISFYGPGFEIIYSGNDTLICHGGANGGFRNIMFYSVKSKSGFVLMTNQEWGKKLAAFIARETTSLDISPRLLQDDFEDQYPDHTTALLKLYRQKGMQPFRHSLDTLSSSGNMGPKTLSELGYFFYGLGQEDLTRKFFTQNITLFPKREFGYLDYGYYYMEKKQFDSAYKYFNAIRNFGGDTTMMFYQLRNCEKKLGLSGSYHRPESREALTGIVSIRPPQGSSISLKENTIQATITVRREKLK
ncbi:MAG: serine hydrolase [Bacteroidetes bacterium]|nr:serine hydrolase [Bacteroidota bacterium]